MNVGDLNNVWEVKALKKPGEDEARKILDRIAKQVQPIMRKHKWRVKVLSEFCPKNPSLLGLNVGGGVHVKLRLRRPNRDWDFIPFNQVLDTMLHELCHNAHGPHNASFYKLWDELRKECEELMAKGITGTAEGFDLPGRRLGGFSHQPPLSSLRQTALGAAQKRARLGSLLPSGPKRLGGDSTIMVSLSPIQAAAMAAERRFQDEIWCGSQSIDISGDEENSCNPPNDITHGGKRPINSINHGSNDKKEGYKSESSSSFLSSNGKSGSRFVDLTNGPSNLGSTHDHDTKSRKRSLELDSSVASQSFDYYPESSASPQHVQNLISADTRDECAMWECGTCTLLNPPLAPLCKLCGTQKPKDADTKYKSWFCKFCTLENSAKLDKCSACEQWRYSNGPPMSSRAPNLGT